MVHAAPAEKILTETPAYRVLPDSSGAF